MKNINSLLKSGRVETIVQAGYILSKKYEDIPVIGNITGPISTSASIVDPMMFLRELRKDKVNSNRVIDYVSDFLIAYSALLIENGAKIISIGDPSATGEILGPRLFEEFAVPYLNKVIDSIHNLGARVIVHICGNMNMVRHLLKDIRTDAISTDAMVNLKALKEEYPVLTTMGNLSTYLLEFSGEEKIRGATEVLLRDGIDIISPACGLSTSTPLSSIRALTGAVRDDS
jgi:[methyl-Co(III) methanol-specific corrinoid protein]:coenzyme M methyltransferase